MVLMTAIMVTMLLPIAGVGRDVYADPTEKTIISAKAKLPSITKTSEQEFEVASTSDVKYLMLYAEDGKTLVRTWQASGNSTLSGSNRKWTVSHAIGNPGSRKLVFKGGTTSATPVTNPVTVSFMVENSGIISASAKNAVIKKGTAQEFTVKSTSDTKYLYEYAENGNLVKTWTASSTNSTVSGNVRTWKVTQTIGDPGKRSLTFKAESPTVPTTAQRTVKFTVEEVWVNSASASDAYIGKGGKEYFTVKTNSTAQYLMMYAEGGNLVKTWAASGNSTVSGSERTWKVDYSIANLGNRELTFKAGKTKTPSSLSKSVKFSVVEKKIIRIDPRYSSITKTGEQEFAVTTTDDFVYLMVFAEDGKTRVKAWPSFFNSTDGISGTSYTNLRTWRVVLDINNPGNRELIFKGGAFDLVPVTNSYYVRFRVENTGVLGAGCEFSTIISGGEQVFTVVTSKDAKYLVEYAEDGKTVVKTWTASASNSEISGNTRRWTLPQTIQTAGERTLYFAAGATSTPTSARRSVSFTVLDSVPITKKYFPDNIFRSILSDEYDKNHDGVLQKSELQVKEMDLSYNDICDLRGIEFFIQLEWLNLNTCNVSQLDLRQNTKLEELDCMSNELTYIELSRCKALKELNCAFNEHLTTLDLSQNKALKILNCCYCGLTELDVSACSVLRRLDCFTNQIKSLKLGSALMTYLETSNNQLETLDISMCSGLKELYCGNNLLKKLDVGSNPLLETLSCLQNQLKTLDVSKNTALVTLSCLQNQITKLDVTNCELLEDLYVDPGVEVIGMHPVG